MLMPETIKGGGMSEAVLTVSALNEYVSCLIGGDPMLKSLRVRGEISGFKRHTSGHLYFSSRMRALWCGA